MATRRVVVENRKTGEQYAVTPAAFRSHYEELGFKIVGWEGGEPYEEQGDRKVSEPTAGTLTEVEERSRRAARARERRAARRAAKQAEA